MVKNPPAKAGDVGSVPGSGRSLGDRNDNPIQYSLGKSHGQRSLAGYSQSMVLQRVRHNLATEQQLGLSPVVLFSAILSLIK